MKHKWQHGIIFASFGREVYPIYGRYKIMKAKLDQKRSKVLFELGRIDEPMTMPKRKKVKCR